MSIAFRAFRYGSSGGSSVTRLPGTEIVLHCERSLPPYIPRSQGTRIATLQDLSLRHEDPIQPVQASQPSIDLTSCPGRPALSFEGGQHMKIANTTARLQTIVMVVMVPADAATGQVVITQDTAATTDKPAFAVQAG